MASRLNLQAFLENILGSPNVYFQPPASVIMEYPAIVFSRKEIANTHANNLPYTQSYSYDVIVIDKNPDSEIVQKISKLPLCQHNAHYTKDNLNHDSFTLYY